MTTVGSAIMCIDLDGAPWIRLRNKPIVQENICPLFMSALVSQCQSNIHHVENRFRNDLFSPRKAREEHCQSRVGNFATSFASRSMGLQSLS